jgi:hypothetical protein
MHSHALAFCALRTPLSCHPMLNSVLLSAGLARAALPYYEPRRLKFEKIE